MRVGEAPVSLADLSAALYARFREDVPPATFEVQPKTDQIVGIPTVVYATGQHVPRPTYTVHGIRVALTLTPHYVWDFGEGEPVDSGADPGRPYAGDFAETIEHAYASPGRKAVTLTATWRATFTAFGETFAVDRPVVRREAPRPLLVREARAQLEDG